MTDHWQIRFSPQSISDLRRIGDFLIETDRATGNTLVEAVERAEGRLVRIQDAIRRIARAPFQGTRDDSILPQLRHVTKERAIIYFTLDEPDRIVHVLAVFSAVRITASTCCSACSVTTAEEPPHCRAKPSANSTASPCPDVTISPSHITRLPRTIVPTGQPVTVRP